MNVIHTRISWDTNMKIYVRNGLHKSLPKEMLKTLHRSNIHRWKNEPENKYENCGIQNHIKQDIDFLIKQNKYPSSKKLSNAYIQLLEGAYHIYDQIKSFRKIVSKNKETVVNCIESIKEYIPTKEAIKLFKISRATYQNYKTVVLNKCVASYFEWCVKRYPQQLLNQEIAEIKNYFKNPDYQFWSKSSLYYLGLRNKDFGFCMATFYKYAKLLGFKNGRHLQNKIKYNPLKSSKPNDIWCADVTILKTADNVKHYIHFLIDHYSKMILGYEVDSKANPKIIKSLLENAFEKYSNKEAIDFVTDGGIENINNTVQNYVLSTEQKIIHKIAQNDIPQSNSVIEAINKIMKHQYLLPQNLQNSSQLKTILPEVIYSYCYLRPQHSLRGNTPFETHIGKPIAISQYNTHFNVQKTLRKTQNKLNRCKKCVN